MFRNIKIGIKILCVILVTSLLTLLVISVISYRQMLNLTKYSQDANIQLGITASEKSKDALLTQAENYLGNIVSVQTAGTNAVLSQVHNEVTAMADYVTRLYKNMAILPGKEIPLPPETEMGMASAKYILAPGVDLTKEVQAELRLISNAEFMLGATLESNDILDNTYLGTQSGISYRYSRSNLYNPGYDPRQRSWYIAAMQTPGKTVWMDTYLDAYGTLAITCARAFTDSAGKPIGVMASDITLNKMIERITRLRIGTGGYAFLLDVNGKYIVHPLYGKERFGISALEGNASDSWRGVLAEIMRGQYGVRIADVDGAQRYIVSQAVAQTGWILCVTIPIGEVIMPAEQTKIEINTFTDQAQLYIQKSLSSVLMRFIIVFAVSAILIVAFSFVLSQTITRPIEQLAEKVRLIGTGDLNSKIETRGKDEIAELAGAFNAMTTDLQAYINNLQEVTAEKERINSELTVASNIQNDMLPRIFPKFSGHQNLELFAKMVPARHVGGDFYDFFYVGDDQSKIAFIIADVSGKGVPASLFMVIAKTLIKTHVSSGLNTADSLTLVNNMLCEDNHSSMFVTAFLCILDLQTGILNFCNAGHNKPLISLNGEPFGFMDIKRGLPLAVKENTKYLSCELQLHFGDKLYLYTDGINEAESITGEFFGNERFLQTANALRDLAPEAFDQAVRSAIVVFINGAEQSDDIATLAIGFRRSEAK
jgi:sigma-B regulation protein RsbU (phosphoserine phosphatase)